METRVGDHDNGVQRGMKFYEIQEILLGFRFTNQSNIRFPVVNMSANSKKHPYAIRGKGMEGEEVQCCDSY